MLTLHATFPKTYHKKIKSANANVTIPEVITTNSITSESSSVSLLAGSPGHVKTAAEKLAAKQKKQNQLQMKILIMRRKMMVLLSSRKFMVRNSTS